jgi:DNA-directed RNA polymerase specialized sigma24 family protein
LDDRQVNWGDPGATPPVAGNPIEEMLGEASFQRVFEELSINQRETFQLHFSKGFSLAEIGRSFGAGLSQSIT